MAGVICVALVVGCTASDDDGQDDTAVAGAVLERDEDGEPASPDDPDDERVDPREDAGSDETTDPDDTSDETTEDAAAEDGSSATADDDEADDDATTSEAGTSSEAPSNGGTGQEPSSPPARPTPATLAAGTGLVGDVVGFGTDGAEVLVGGAIESPPAVGARSDAQRVGDGYEVRCRTSLQAPQDRGLLARGDLSVDLMLEHHDGSERRVALQIMDLDVELEAGERFDLPTSGARAVDPDEVASVVCEPRFVPG